MGIHDLGLFMVAGLLLNVTPGPDMALIIAHSTQRGTSAGIAAAALGPTRRVAIRWLAVAASG